jgi:hypothetical protein
MAGYKITGIFLVFILLTGLTGIAFAEYGDDNSNTNQASHTNEKSKDGSIDENKNYTT